MDSAKIAFKPDNKASCNRWTENKLAGKRGNGMGKKHEEEIEQKLRELEISMKEATNANLPAAIGKSKELSRKTSQPTSRAQEEAGPLTADLHLLGGCALMIVGLFVLFSHMTVMSGQPMMWGLGGMGGSTGTGALILTLLVGLGFFFYDYKNKIGWLLVACSLAALIFSILATMRLVLLPMDLLSLLFMFLPLIIGSAFLAKGVVIHNKVNAQKTHDK
jgi:hypothetical protein